MSSYLSFLDTKPLFYDEIDYKRMPRVWKRIKPLFKQPKIIHIVGTNGKGTTGRFLAWHLYKSGYKTGHYSSPHILRFNERVWVNGKDCSDEKLQEAHEYLLKILKQDEIERLSYFEYTTLMAIYLFQEMDFAVMEAGMGGEFDATSVFDSMLSLVTPIDYDHEAFLGNSIKDIALTKLRSVKKEAILSKQPHKEVYEIAKKLSSKMGFRYYFYRDLLDDDMIKAIDEFSKDVGYGGFLKENLSLGISALKHMKMDINLDLFRDLTLFGRFQKIEKNITIDVGHNQLAAKEIVKEFKDKRVVLIYNTYKDKNYKEILDILKPIIKRVEIIPINQPRAENVETLKSHIKNLALKVEDFKEIKENEEYLVFGSFSVVEEFLKRYRFER